MTSSQCLSVLRLAAEEMWSDVLAPLLDEDSQAPLAKGVVGGDESPGFCVCVFFLGVFVQNQGGFIVEL